MDEFLEYIAELIKVQEAGELPSYPEPAAPVDLGTPLTQTEIDWVKKLKKEVEERFLEEEA